MVCLAAFLRDPAVPSMLSIANASSLHARPMKYVLITPARNEEKFIAKTLDSMIAQTLLPERWVIVDDGSTDKTPDLIQQYARQYSWIEFVRREQRPDRSFSGKVCAFNAGFERLRSLEFEIIGNLDADLSFDPEYLEFL